MSIASFLQIFIGVNDILIKQMRSLSQKIGVDLLKWSDPSAVLSQKTFLHHEILHVMNLS